MVLVSGQISFKKQCLSVRNTDSSAVRFFYNREWTTEKEINVFTDFGISDVVTQTIDGALLENFIEFRKGGGLRVSGDLSVPEQGGKRTNFKFTTATLDLGRWGTYKIPPVGEGWFETVYLDKELRVDCNSRDDILICTSSTQNE